MAQSREKNMEFGLYLNGSPVSSLWFANMRIQEGFEWSVSLPSRRHGAENFTVRGRFSGEIVKDWVSGEMWLIDNTNCPISTPRPFLMFLGASDVPMTTVFPSLEAHPLTHSGIWVVTTRAADSMHRLKEKAGVPNGAAE